MGFLQNKRMPAFPVAHPNKKSVQTEYDIADGIDVAPFQSESFGTGKTHNLLVAWGTAAPSASWSDAPAGTLYFQYSAAGSKLWGKLGTDPTDLTGSWVGVALS